MIGASLGPPGLGKFGSTYPAYSDVGGPDMTLLCDSTTLFHVLRLCDRRAVPEKDHLCIFILGGQAASKRVIQRYLDPSLSLTVDVHEGFMSGLA